MNIKRIISLMLALLLIASLAACAQPAPAVDEPAPQDETATPTVEGGASTAISVTDMAGHELALDAPATRIVALTASDCEILYAIGAGDTIVGRGEYCDYPAEVMDVASVQSGSETNLEQIIALQPELVIMSTMAQTEEQVASLENAGIKVAVSSAQDIAGVYDAITLIGALTGHNDEAAALNASMQEGFSAITQAESTGKSVYFEVSPLEYGLWTAGSGTFMDEIATMLGLENAFSDVEGWAEISEEQVIERDPDYIVTITMYFGEGPTPVEEILSRAGWKDMKAVTGGAVFNADSDALSRPGPRLVEGAEQLNAFITDYEAALQPAA